MEGHAYIYNIRYRQSILINWNWNSVHVFPLLVPHEGNAKRDFKHICASATQQEPGGAQSEDDGGPIEDDADFDELDDFPQPPPLKERGMEHGGSEQTAISRQAPSAGTNQMSDLAMVSKSTHLTGIWFIEGLFSSS